MALLKTSHLHVPSYQAVVYVHHACRSSPAHHKSGVVHDEGDPLSGTQHAPRTLLGAHVVHVNHVARPVGEGHAQGLGVGQHPHQGSSDRGEGQRGPGRPGAGGPGGGASVAAFAVWKRPERHADMWESVCGRARWNG